MSGDESAEFGTSEGTHAGENPAAAVDAGKAAKVGATRATVDAAMADLVAGIGGQAEAEQPSLMLDEIDEQHCLFAGPVRHVAKTLDGARGRGRPRGAQNKNSFRDTLLRMGFKHPGLNLAAMANADPAALAIELGALPEPPDGASAYDWLDAMVRTGSLKRADVATLIAKAHDLIGRANAELMPYFESKRPQEIDVTTRALGVMVIGEMKAETGNREGVIDLTSVESPSE